MLLWPAFEFQSHLREATLGTERWEDIYRSLQHSRYLEEYMRMHGTMPPEERSGLLEHRWPVNFTPWRARGHCVQQVSRHDNGASRNALRVLRASPSHG